MPMYNLPGVMPALSPRTQREPQAAARGQHAIPAQAHTPSGETLLQALLHVAEQDTFSRSHSEPQDAPKSLKSPWTATPEAVIEKIQGQQAVIPAGDIEDIIVSNFPVADHRLAALLLDKMTGFASMKSLNGLQGKLLSYSQHTNQFIYYEREGSLGSTLHYLTKKYKYSKGLPSPFNKNNSVQKEPLNTVEEGAILLDAITLDQLAQSPALRQHIAQHKLPLLYPQGWEEGINPFNQLSIEGTSVKLAKLVSIAKQLQQEQGLSEDESVQQALSHPTRSRLASWGLAHHLRILEPGLHPFNVESKPNRFPSSDKIADQMAPASISKEELERVLQNFQDPILREGALDVLARQAEIFSPLRLSLTAHALHLKILDYAKKHHIAADDIFYHVPANGKSFGLISANHLMVNEVPLGQLIEDPATLKKPSKSLLVILDDVAGSGYSLLTAQKSIRTKGFNGKIIVAPIISTKKAKTLIQKSSDPNVEYLAGHQVLPFKNQPAYKALSPMLQKLMRRIIGSLGFDRNGLSVAFPYMAPDNNNAFFSREIAPYFTLNRAGAKSWGFNFPSKGLDELMQTDFENHDSESDDSDMEESYSQNAVAPLSLGGLKKSPAQMNLSTHLPEDLMVLEDFMAISPSEETALSAMRSGPHHSHSNLSKSL